ncbi:MAG: alanine racemase [Pseudomonadota bacterium]
MSTAPRLTINLSNLVDNWKTLAAMTTAPETSAVVKANAYGIGIEEAVNALYKAGCKTFFVAMIEEGARARKVAPDARIFALNGIFPDTVDRALADDISPVLSTLDQVKLWASCAQGRSSAIHVDTGMNRLGMDLKEAEALAGQRELIEQSGAQILMSHLGCADDPKDEVNHLQFQRFSRIAELYPDLRKSLLNSAGIIGNPDMAFDLTRPGVALYGGETVNGIENPMKPVVTAETRILQIRHAQKGELVGYGRVHKLTRDTVLATCSSGYADGYHRTTSGSGVPLREPEPKGGIAAIGDYRVPILGRVSMDLTIFDVTDVPTQVIEENEWIELFGNKIAIDDVARSAGTIGYELLTGLGRRYHREYIES